MNSAVFLRTAEARLTLEEVVFCVLVRVVGAADDVEGRPARHHLEHEHA